MASELDTSLPVSDNGRRHPSLPLPQQFDGTSELWPRWRARFQRYKICSGLSNKPDNEQVGTLLYSMGDCADDILAVIKLDESHCTYLEALSALDTSTRGKTLSSQELSSIAEFSSQASLLMPSSKTFTN